MQWLPKLLSLIGVVRELVELVADDKTIERARRAELAAAMAALAAQVALVATRIEAALERADDGPPLADDLADFVTFEQVPPGTLGKK